MLTVDIVTWANAHHYDDALAQSYKVRHRAFIEKQNWDVPHCHGMEYDTYDTPAAVYLLARNEFGNVLGLTRLIPTLRPYMLDEIWPNMLGKHAGTRQETIWEATRFAVDPTLDQEERSGVALAITQACLEFGLANGIQSYLVLSPLAILRRVIGPGGAGCEYTQLGDQEVFGRTRVMAAEVTVNAETLSNVKDKFGTDNVINHRSLNIYGQELGQELYQQAA
ncbi:acyl-homoserine-lactone synthase [Magnetovibrio sp. PR-2]|uniref:acyl-homoserine-lactone synthase n=1 Tax=Magnetovibrio sp. PR-2 TaxID=3120356 RepID=UPI002FCDEFA3